MPGQHEVGADVRQRLQHEAAERQAWMWDDEHGIVTHVVAGVEEIEMESRGEFFSRRAGRPIACSMAWRCACIFCGEQAASISTTLFKNACVPGAQ